MTLEDKVAELTRQRDELLNALKKIDEFGFAMGMTECKRLASEAIAATERHNAAVSGRGAEAPEAKDDGCNASA